MATVTIHTPQNVRIDFATAGVGVRIGAFCLDLILLGLTYGLALLALDALGARLNAGVAFRLAPVFYLLLYFFCWELLSGGQTAGKRVLGLRVMRLDGRALSPSDLLARSVFLLADVVFTAGLLAVLLVTTGPRRQRLGDLVARTAVIRLPRGGVGLADILSIRPRQAHVATYPGVQALTDADMLTVKECLLRYRRYRNTAHREALAALASRMGELLDLAPEAVPTPHESFLETVLLDYIVLTR